MRSEFPIVGIVTNPTTYRLITPAALTLGIDTHFLDSADFSSLLKFSQGCDLVSIIGSEVGESTIRILEREGIAVRPNSLTWQSAQKFLNTNEIFEREYAVIVARSPHNQACIWTPSQITQTQKSKVLHISPPQDLSTREAAEIHNLVLDAARRIELVGVASVKIGKKNGKFEIRSIELGPDSAGLWTVNGSITNQFEQHLRAILDLPLGDPATISRYAVTAEFFRNGEADMYRPYLHLMARDPALKIHQYRNVNSGPVGYVSTSGGNLLDLVESVEHALGYLNGEIDE